MGKLKDITGQRFGKLVAVRPLGKHAGNGSMIWECACDCGNTCEAPVTKLKAGKKKSCGCMRKESRAIDIAGQRFGHLTVVDRAYSKRSAMYWNCVCDCGNDCVVSGNELRNGRRTSCGCGNVKREREPGARGRNFKDITGQRFGRLVAIEPLEQRTPEKLVVWRCRCDCGNEVDVPGALLRKGNTRSCGCLFKDAVRADLVGKRFGKLVVRRATEKRRRDSVIWECECDCGKIVEASTPELTGGHATSCGCDSGGPADLRYSKDLSGQRFGKLTAMCPVGRKNGYVLWECVCDCGKVKQASSDELNSGHVKSCGCLARRKARHA